MKIWIDSDSCPVRIREIIVRAAARTGIPAEFVANRKIPGVETEVCCLTVVEKGEGVADKYIVDHCAPGDLAITRDIPLAADLSEKGLLVLDDRGGIIDRNNVRERLSVRNAMTELRSYGIQSEKTKPMTRRDLQQFANALDQHLRRWVNKSIK